MEGYNKFSNKYIAHLLRSVAAAYLLKGKNKFKIIAYENAADTVEHLTRELKDLWEEKGFNQIQGIGPSIASHLDQYFKEGRSKHFEEILKDIPETVFELMKVRSIGPKRGFKLVKSLGLLNKKRLFEELKQACRQGRVARIPGFGQRSQEEILKAVEQYEKSMKLEKRMPLPYAFSIASEIVNYLKKHPKVKEVSVLGSLRRMLATIGDIDIAVKVEEEDFNGEGYKEIIDYFIGYPKAIRIDNAGKKKASIILSPNIRVDLRVIEVSSYGAMVQYFTGSKIHNIKLREYGLAKGYSLSEYGIKKISRGKKREKNKAKVYRFSKEEEFYQFLGLQFIPPELREGTNEIDLAIKNKIPILVKKNDIKGDFHIHSNYDLKPAHDLGKNSYKEIVAKGISLGYQYLGFADHNPSFSNHSQDRIIDILKQRKLYIDEKISGNKFERLKIFIGLEVDILPDGKIAIPEKGIKYLDYLIVSIHSSFQMSQKKMTERVLAGLGYPKVKIFAHPTCRLLNSREGIELDWEKVFEFCLKKNIALEINSSPQRLDLPDVLVRQAVNHKVKLVINTDSHANHQMDNMFYGVAVARRGWAKKSDIINTQDLDKVRKWIEA